MSRKINRHAQKRKHIRELERKYATKYHFGRPCNVRLLRDELEQNATEDWWWNIKHPPRNKGWEYWKTWYISGRRKYAKDCTNRVVRAYYRDILSSLEDEDIEDIQALKGSDYEKMYDYNWTIW